MSMGGGVAILSLLVCFMGMWSGLDPGFPPKLDRYNFICLLRRQISQNYAIPTEIVWQFQDFPIHQEIWRLNCKTMSWQPKLRELECLPSSIGVLISLKETNLNVTHDKLYLTRKSRRPFYIMQIAKQELSDTCMDENRCPILKTLIYFMQKNSTIYASKSHEHPKFIWLRVSHPSGILPYINPLSLNIHIQFLQTDLYTFHIECVERIW